MSIKGRFFRTVVYAGAGAAAAYFFDGERGEARRAQAREQLEARLRKAGLSATPSEPAAGPAVLDMRDAPDQPAPDETGRQASQTAAAAGNPTLGSAVE
jgi:hypothetical protein